MTTDSSINPFIDASSYYDMDDQQLQIKMGSIYGDMAGAINGKVIGTYDIVEQISGKQFYNSTTPQNLRTGFRKVFSFGAIVPGATLPIDHGLTNITQYTFIGGVCLTAFDSRPIPYASANFVTDQIGIRVTSTQIEIFNGATGTPIISGEITLEYLKN
jgi:hypothetical protein